MKGICKGIIIFFILICICSAEPDISIYVDGVRLDTETLGYLDGADYCVALSEHYITQMEGGVLDISRYVGCNEEERVYAIFESPLVNIKDGIISFNLFPENYDEGSIRKLGYIFKYRKTDTGKDELEVCTIGLSRKEDSYYFTISNNDGQSTKISLEEQIGRLKNNLLFVNRDNPLDKNYKPNALVKIDGNKISAFESDSRLLNKNAAEALYKMLSEANKQGIKKFIIESSYRTLERQKAIFDYQYSVNKKRGVKNPYEETHKRVALPGTSEHHTGLCFDIVCSNAKTEGAFGKTAQAKWIAENVYKFGLIVRYPADKQKETYTIYEPWHIRYIGEPHSALLRDRNLCMEEYMSYLEKNKITSYNDKRTGKNYVICYSDSLNIISSDEIKNINYEISEASKGNYIITFCIDNK